MIYDADIITCSQVLLVPIDRRDTKAWGTLLAIQASVPDAFVAVRTAYNRGRFETHHHTIYQHSFDKWYGFVVCREYFGDPIDPTLMANGLNEVFGRLIGKGCSEFTMLRGDWTPNGESWYDTVHHVVRMFEPELERVGASLVVI